MSARPCPIKLDICPDSDSPVLNISAEAPDPLLFFGTAWPQYDPYAPAPLFFPPGSNFTLDCQQVQTVSAGSQELADLLAQALDINCPNSGGPYANDEQTASATCADGSTATYTVPAGTLTFSTDNAEEGAAWVAYANAWALAYAFDQVSAQLACITTPPANPDDPPTTPHRRGGSNFSTNSAWICIGNQLTQEENTYSVSGNGSYTFEITSGALPPGTSLIQTGVRSAAVVGLPTDIGVFTYTITATRVTSPPFVVSATDTLYVFGISNADSLPDASSGVAYGPEQLNVGGGITPITFAVVGSLPVGFSLSSTGVLTSDTSSVADDYTFDVKITDAEGGECTQTVSLTVASSSICDFDPLAAALVDPGFGPISGHPQWNGVFDQATTSPSSGDPVYYFLSQSLMAPGGPARSVSADDIPDYDPMTNVWADEDFTKIWNSFGTWSLAMITATGVNPSNHFWIGDGPVFTGDPDPSGIYSFTNGSSPPFSIQVTAVDGGYCCSMVDCPDWNSLLWGVPSVVTGGAGSGSFTPASSKSSTWDVQADAPDGSVDDSLSQNSATITYAGIGCDCNLHLVLTMTGTTANLCGLVEIVMGFTDLLTIDVNAMALPAGTYDFPFTVPDTGGTPVVITVSSFAQAPCLANVPGHQAIELSCSLTNV